MALMKITTFGPNLSISNAPHLKAHGETFHVHAADCADCNRYRALDRSAQDVASRTQVVEAIYGGIIAEGSLTIEDALNNEFWFAPCCDGLAE